MTTFDYNLNIMSSSIKKSCSESSGIDVNTTNPISVGSTYIDNYKTPHLLPSEIKKLKFLLDHYDSIEKLSKQNFPEEFYNECL